MNQEPKPPTTQTEAFVYYLERMDDEMLELILEEDATYFGVSKATFLARLKAIFKQVKLAGLNNFIRVKKMKTDAQKYRISWFDDEDYQNIQLRVKDSKIREIALATKNQSYEEGYSPFNLVFGQDEQKDFKPSIAYLLELHQCEQAYEELIQDEIRILDEADIQAWINKHASLFEAIEDKDHYFKLYPFKDLYTNLSILLEELAAGPQVRYALHCYRNLNKMDIEEWMEEFNRLYYCETMAFHFTLKDWDKENLTVKTILYPNMVFKGQVFFDIHEFNSTYEHFYQVLYESENQKKD